MARFDSTRKLERNGLLIDYYTTHPELSLREIGGVFSISRQRVWQIVSNHEKMAAPAIQEQLETTWREVLKELPLQYLVDELYNRKLDQHSFTCPECEAIFDLPPELMVILLRW